MTHEKLATTMAGLLEYEKQVKQYHAKLEQVESYPLTDLGTNGYLNFQDIQKAQEEESHVAQAKEALSKAKATYDKEVGAFLDSLPTRVVNLMRDQAHVVIAHWVTQDANAHHYGPYAAYFKNSSLIIEPYPDGIEALKARLKSHRESK